MERRGFLKLLGLGVAGIALDQAIPFNRVWSFPKNIVVPELTLEEIEERYLMPAVLQMIKEHNDFLNSYERVWDEEFAVGTRIAIRIPQRFSTPAFPPAPRPSSS